MENNDQISINQELKIENEVNHQEKKKPKKFNGFIRNNNKRKNKKPKADLYPIENDDLNENSERTESIVVPIIREPKQTQEEYEIFNFLRAKTGYNEKKFWDNLAVILQTKGYSEIKKNNLSLISYAVLHDCTIVYSKLLEKFKKDIVQEEFVNSVFKNAIHKNPELAELSIKFYEKNFSIEQTFIEQLIKDISCTSYRYETNDLFLSWISPKINNDLLNLFWNESILFKNTPIIIQALEHKPFLKYLKENIEQYEISLKSIGKFIEIKSIIYSVKEAKKVENSKGSVIINKPNVNKEDGNFEPEIWLSDKQDQFQTIQNKLSDKKAMEVVVKRKRKIV